MGASLVGTPGCGDDELPNNPNDDVPVGTYAFPQGVASGDPRAASVVLWTRVVLADDAARSELIQVKVQVSADAAFGSLVVDQAVSAGPPTDHTVRVVVTGLAAATTYHYRFVAGKDAIEGRTRTAAAADADVQVNLAWVSCQDYSAGHYGAYRQMIVDDEARPEADRIHAVVHLGDMIYETGGDEFQGAIDEDFEPIMLKNRDGSDRVVGPFPSGGGTVGTGKFAVTVDDYRHLYKTFLSDPDLQAARARWPFVSIWDDHEFTDDCWQSQANYTVVNSIDEPDQARRVAASRAWFEYIPVHLTGAGSVTGVANPARDFEPVMVTDAAFTTPNADNFVAEPNNAAAIGAITIYRSLRFGKHVELVMTDQRSYRSDHAIPEELTLTQTGLKRGFFAQRNVMPISVVDIFDKGSTARLTVGDTAPPATLPFGPDGPLNNPRTQSPIGTMLGKAQKAWWKATMKGSDATWKLWGSETMVMRLQLTTGGNPALIENRVISADAWDGYPTERKELMGYLNSESIKNVVVLTGDIHASFAGTISVDPLIPDPPIACELVASGVSSNSLFSFFRSASSDPAFSALVSLDATDRGFSAHTENLNLLLRHGTRAAGAFAQGVALEDATKAPFSEPDANPHVKYVDTNAQGYGYVKANGTQVAATIITINRPLTVPPATGPGIKRTASFTIPKDNPGGMTGPVFTGTKPFPEV